MLDLRRLEIPVVQAGMGSVAMHELAAAVSAAGGLGTIGGVRAKIASELIAARRLTDRPLAVNLLLPFAEAADVEAAAAADAIVTFWGKPRRLAECVWIHQCGSVPEAKAAAAAGADAVIAQGVEAGGHVRGTMSTLELVQRMREAIPMPILAAGGIVDRAGVRSALDAGAVAAVLGTRFLLSEESRAHPGYKRRCVEANSTLLTELFGLGWPDAPHRVIPNAVTDRWLGVQPRGPGWVRMANRITAPAVRRLPRSVQDRALLAQRPWLPFFGPRPPTIGDPDSLLDAGPLYAGASVGQITEILPARELVAALKP